MFEAFRLNAAFVFLNNDLKAKISRSILTKTPADVFGLSMEFCLIHGKDFCWPQVVGILNGTAEAAHPLTLITKPIRNAAIAKYGISTPKTT